MINGYCILKMMIVNHHHVQLLKNLDSVYILLIIASCVINPRYHITNKQKFYYTLGKELILHPSPGCVVNAYNTVGASEYTVSNKGVYTISSKDTCDFIVLSTLFDNKLITITLDCDICKHDDSSSELLSRINFKTTSKTATAKIYQGNRNQDNYIKEVAITSTMNSICFTKSPLIFDFKEYNNNIFRNSEIVVQYSLNNYLVYEGSIQDGTHIIEYDIIPMHSEYSYFFSDTTMQSDWNKLNFAESAWSKGSFPNIKIEKGKSLYARKKFKLTEDCLGGIISLYGKCTFSYSYYNGNNEDVKTIYKNTGNSVYHTTFDFAFLDLKEHVLSAVCEPVSLDSKIPYNFDIKLYCYKSNKDLGIYRIHKRFGGSTGNGYVFDYLINTYYSGTASKIFSYTFKQKQYINGISIVSGKIQTITSMKVYDDKNNIFFSSDLLIFNSASAQVNYMSAFEINNYPNILYISFTSSSNIIIRSATFYSYNYNDVCESDKGFPLTPPNSYSYRYCSYASDDTGYEQRKCNSNNVWEDIEYINCNECGENQYKIRYLLNIGKLEKVNVTQDENKLEQKSSYSNNYYYVCADISKDVTFELYSDNGELWAVASYIEFQTIDGKEIFKSTYSDLSEEKRIITFYPPVINIHSNFKYTNVFNSEWYKVNYNFESWKEGNILNIKNKEITTYIKYKIPSQNKVINNVILKVFYQDGYIIYFNDDKLDSVNIPDMYIY